MLDAALVVSRQLHDTTHKHKPGQPTHIGLGTTIFRGCQTQVTCTHPICQALWKSCSAAMPTQGLDYTYYILGFTSTKNMGFERPWSQPLLAVHAGHAGHNRSCLARVRGSGQMQTCRDCGGAKIRCQGRSKVQAVMANGFCCTCLSVHAKLTLCMRFIVVCRLSLGAATGTTCAAVGGTTKI